MKKGKKKIFDLIEVEVLNELEEAQIKGGRSLTQEAHYLGHACGAVLHGQCNTHVYCSGANCVSGCGCSPSK